jgi:membrane protein
MSRTGKQIRQILRGLRALEIPLHGANACYFMVLSVFPSLVLVLGLLGYTGLKPEDLMNFAEGFLPTALHGYVWQLIGATYAHTSRAVLSLSALAALWSASRGIYGLMGGLNAVYGVKEDRGWLRTRLKCAVYMVMFLAVLMLTLVLHVFGNTILEFLRHRRVAGGWILTNLVGVRFVLLVLIQTLLFTAMFMFLPHCRNGFRESLPGALLGSLGWMSASSAFSVYVRNFNRYATIFGSVYMMALVMLWLYVCICILFYGGVLNRWLKN